MYVNNGEVYQVSAKNVVTYDRVALRASKMVQNKAENLEGKSVEVNNSKANNPKNDAHTGNTVSTQYLVSVITEADKTGRVRGIPLSAVNNLFSIKGKDTLGYTSRIRDILSAYVRQEAYKGNWFTVINKIDEKQVDLMSLKNTSGHTLGAIINNVTNYDNVGYQENINRFLLNNFLCYIEVPISKFNKDLGTYIPKYDKLLCTSNADIACNWLGEDNSRVHAKLSGVIKADTKDYPIVSFSKDKEGNNKVSIPRKGVDLSHKGIRVIPLFLVEAGISALYDMGTVDTLEINYLKDAGAMRSLVTTFDMSIVESLYGRGDFYFSVVDNGYKGDFLSGSHINRGYIKVVELGGSKYDYPLRSINFTRIVSITKGVQPDTTFIGIDITKTKEVFENGVLTHARKVRTVVKSIRLLGLDAEGYWEKAEVYNLDSLLAWYASRELVYGTVFRRGIVKLMLSLPDIFSFDAVSSKGSESEVSVSNEPDVTLGLF